MRRKPSPGFTIFLTLLIFLQLEANAFAGITFIAGQGLMLTGAEGLVLAGAEGMILTGADGMVLAGAEGMFLTGAEGIVLAGAEALTYTGAQEIVNTGLETVGLQGVDVELAALLDPLPDSSAINVFVVFHHMPTEADLDSLRAVGVVGGTRFYNLPMVMINATKGQVASISTLPSVRSLYSNKTFEFFTHDTRVITGQTKVIADRALTTRNGGLPILGRGVTVAVLDTGIDATHTDLGYGAQVIQNVRVTDLQGSPPAFIYPVITEGLPDTDLTLGHGTFVAGVLAGTGAFSTGYYGGLAPGAHLLGVGVGDATLFYVLSGMDYILSHRADQNIRVVNCSFGISGLFDVNDPVNIATKIMHDAGISVVFSAGNSGDQPNSLNPYSVADWVVGVGSGTKDRKLSSFSSRGAASYAPYHPTLVAPGENVVSARATGINVIATSGLASGLASPENDARNISPLFLPRYTMSSGTSFAAPHVAAAIAMMLEAAPQLTPDEIKRVLQETATPMLGYSRYEVGAGYLNTYAAVLKVALGTPFGGFRSLLNQTVSYSRDALNPFNGEIAPGSSYVTTFNVPDNAIYSTAQVVWLNHSAVASSLSMTITRGSQVFTSKPAALLAGQRIQKTGVTINDPAPGEWTITVTNTSTAASALQSFAGAIEVTRASYGDLSDIGQLSASDQQAIKRALRAGLVTAQSAGGFGVNVSATRLDLARATMLGAGALAPQFLPASPSFLDVPAGDNAVFIESVVNSPNGNLLGATGLYFNPQSAADRMTAAKAVVRALGLEALAQASGTTNPGIADWNLVPQSARGYVAVAVTHNLMNTGATGAFRPFDSITRTELARTAFALQQAAR